MKANSINLTATGGATYQWSHVAGFSSSLQNPSILNAKAADSGIYTVVVKDQYDCIDTVSTRVLIIPNAGANDLVAAAGFQLYPNPAYNSFTVETEGSGQLGLKVVNVLGQTVLELQHTGQRINVATETWAPGTYTLILFRGKDLVGEKKIVIADVE